MKKFDDLTRLGRLRRMRQLARTALRQYGMGEAELVFHVQAGNTLYRVYADEQKSSRAQDDLYEPGKYLLRIYQSGWQSAEALELELDWMSAMRHEAGLPLQEPVRRLDGGLLTHVATPGIPEGRYCSLLRWIKGRLLRNYGRPEHYRAQGRLMARMHNFTQEWQKGLPATHTKRQYDWEGLFMNDAEIGLPTGSCWEYLPPDWRAPFEAVSHQTRQLMDSWGKAPDVYGLIHADLGTDANLLFWRGQPRPIDFEASGFGYWMYDPVSYTHLTLPTN